MDCGLFSSPVGYLLWQMCIVWNSTIYIKDRLLSCSIAKCDKVAGLLFACWSNCYESNYLLVLFHKSRVWLCVLLAGYDIFHPIYCSPFNALSISKLNNYSIEVDGFTFRNGSLPHQNEALNELVVFSVFCRKILSRLVHYTFLPKYINPNVFFL